MGISSQIRNNPVPSAEDDSVRTLSSAPPAYDNNMSNPMAQTNINNPPQMNQNTSAYFKY